MNAHSNSPGRSSQEARGEQIRENLARVHERIAAAAARSVREAAAVRLVGVTKYVDSATARLLVLAGLADLGESRPQELWAKAAALADLSEPIETQQVSEPVEHAHASVGRGTLGRGTHQRTLRWHLIGHLQSNKVRRTLSFRPLIHSVDSIKIIEQVSRECQTQGLTSELLVEVNVSGDATKHGLAPAEVEPLLPQIASLPNIAVKGLMTMASREGDLDQARREFAALRELRDRLVRVCPPEISLGDLSMGMSGDFEVAIEEGATMVRVGSALFEGLREGDAP